MNRFLPGRRFGAALMLCAAAGLSCDTTAETLISAQLDRVEDTEVLLQRVAIPANTTLSMHWHPGEEFVYVIEGSVTLLLEGEDPLQMSPGRAVKIPTRAVHSARAGADGVELVIFRVHEAGEPERVLVENR